MEKKKKKYGKPILQLLVIIFAYQLLINTVVVGIGWYRGWTTGYQYGGGTFIGGLLLLGFGLISVMGYWEGTRNFNFLFAKSMFHQSSGERNQSAINEDTIKYRFVTQIILSGITSLIIGSIIQSSF